MNEKEKAKIILKILNRIYPKAPVPLKSKNTFTLLISVLLSAQCTDVNVNNVTKEIYRKAHQTSANYPEQVSEFKACELTPHFSDQISAPYVAESPLKIGLQLEETHAIQANGNTFVVGRIIEIIYPDQVVDENGHIDLSELTAMGVCGLEDYYTLEKKERLPYARP